MVFNPKTKKMKEITKAERAAVFSMYVGQECLSPMGEGVLYGITKSFVEDDEWIALFESDQEEYVQDNCLLLTSLSLITDEDAVEVAKILGNCSHLSKESQISQVKELFSSPNFFVKQTNISAAKWLYVFQYLQSEGYALPYKDYSVEDLVELKIYEIK